MEPLFYNDREILGRYFEKVAKPATKMPNDPDNWTQAILDTLYTQVPYVSEYDVELDLSNMDKEAKTAFGYAIVSSKVVQPKDNEEKRLNKGRDLGIKKIRIPVIVDQGKLLPFDIFLHGGTPHPLNERRIRKCLFRPDMFGAIIKEDPSDSVDYVRTSRASGLGSYFGGPYKMASVLRNSLTDRDFESWNNQIDQDEHLKEAAFSNKTVLNILDTLSSASELHKTASVHDVLLNVEPTALQFRYDTGRDSYILKKASRHSYYPVEQELGRGEAIRMVGEELVKKADMEGPQTLPMEEAVPPPEVEEPQPVEASGFYKLKKSDGSDIYGYVFADVRTLEGTARPYKVMTSGEVGAIQETMFGSPQPGTTPPEGDLKGFGVLFGLYEGDPVCFTPCTIIEKVMFPEGYKVRVEMFGEGTNIDLLISQDVEKPVYTGNRWLIPDTYRWSPINKMVELAESPDATKVASAEDIHSTVRVINSGNSYTFEGRPVEKLGSAVVNMKPADAEFTAALLGYDKEKFASIAGGRTEVPLSSELKGCLRIDNVVDFYDSVKTASAEQRATAKRLGLEPIDLLKEATFLEDPTTVDAVLSLNFLSPENLSIFVSYKDNLDEASKKLAELLLAVRTGVKELPEGAIINAMNSLERVIVALNKLERE